MFSNSSPTQLHLNGTTAEPFTSTQLPNQTTQDEDLNEGFRITIILIGTAVLLSGFLGNVLQLVVIFKRRKLKKRFRNVFIANLALADLLVICSSLPHLLLDLALGKLPVGQLHCQVNAFMLSVSFIASMTSLCLVACHRYVKVCHPAIFHKLFPARRCRLYCAAVWGLALLLNFPFLAVPGITYGYDSESHVCNARADRRYPCFETLATVCILVIPVFPIAYFNIAIFRLWYGSRCKLTKKNPRPKKAGQATRKGFPMDIAALDNSDSKENSDSILDGTTSAVAGGRTYSNDDVGRPVAFKSSSATVVCTTASVRHSQAGPRETTRWCRLRDSRRNTNSGRRYRHHDSTNGTCGNTPAARNQNRYTNNTKKVQQAGEPRPEGGIHISSTAVREEADVHVDTAKHTTTAMVHSEAAATLNHYMSTKRQRESGIRSMTKRPSNRGKKLSPLAARSIISDRVQPPLRTVYGVSDIIEDNVDPATVGDTPDKDCGHVELQERFSDSMVTSVSPKRMAAKSLSFPNIDILGTDQFSTWRRLQHAVASKESRKKGQSDLALVLYLMVSTLCLFVFCTPHAVTIILTCFLQDALPREISVTSVLLIFVNCANNWLVYGVMNTTIRQTYVTTLKGCACVVTAWRKRTTSSASSIGPVTHTVKVSRC